MKNILLLIASLGLTSFTFAEGTAKAEKSKPQKETITGVAQCAKCTMKQSKKCQTAVVVGEGDDAKVYFLKGDKKFHDQICNPGTKLNVTATGIIKESKTRKLRMTKPKVTVIAAK